MKKICTVCGQGLGSSLIVEMNIKSILDNLGLSEDEVNITHKNLNSYSPSDNFDFVVCGVDLSDSIDPGKGQKIVLNNLMDKVELTNKFREIFKK